MQFKGCVYKYIQIIILSETLNSNNFLTSFSMRAITVSWQKFYCVIQPILFYNNKKKWSSILIKFLFAPIYEDNFLSRVV